MFFSLHELYMPFFFKLSDFYKNGKINEEWLNMVTFTVNDFIGTCNEKNIEKGIVFYLFHLDGINVLPKQLMYGHTNLTKYEYQVNEAVSMDHEIQYADDFSVFVRPQTNDSLKNILNIMYNGCKSNPYLLNNAYIHITCNANTTSIDNNGLYSQDQLNGRNDLKIGDYERFGGKSRRKIRKRNKRNKRRSVRKITK